MHAGNCSGPIDLYRNNVSLADNRFNMLWWGYGAGEANATTDTNGTIWGAAPNSWIVRGPLDPNPLGSIVLLPEGGKHLGLGVFFPSSVSYAAIKAQDTHKWSSPLPTCHLLPKSCVYTRYNHTHHSPHPLRLPARLCR